MVTKIEQKKLEMTMKLKNEINGLDDIAITHDGWTSMNTESFSTVTGHFCKQKLGVA